MFIRSVKLKRPALWLAVLILAVIAGAAALAVRASGTGAPVYLMDTESQRQDFIREMGWETSETYTECREVTIPEEWSEVYERYNELQKQQGFDLERYRGRSVEIFTYPVYNYEGHTEKDCMQLTLMVCGGELIGGDVCCTELGGFMQGLRKKE